MYEAEQAVAGGEQDEASILESSPNGPPPEEPSAIRLEEAVVPPRHPRLRLHRQFKSQFLPIRRDVIVALPPGYEQSRQQYPVLYLQDGQNLFDGETSFMKDRIWDVQTTMDRLIEEHAIAPLIVVGVYNTGQARMEEYTPMRDPNLGGGGAEQYRALLIEELKPWIDSTYRTLPGPQHTGVGGSSLGGLVSLYLGLSSPQVFGRVAALSPSVWWARGGLLEYVRRTTPEPRPRIWLDVGLAEGPNMVQRCDALNRLLVRRGWREGKTLHYLRVPDGRHDELAWAARVEHFLRFLFPA